MPRHDPDERTKSEILNTAVRLFAEKGWGNVNVEDVVKEVGVTRGAFYHYFRSREDLIIAVTDRMFHDNNHFLKVSEETGLNALEKLRLAVKLNLSESLKNAGMVDEVLKAKENPVIFKSEFLSQLNTVAPYIEKLLREGSDDGSISVKYPKQAAQVISLLSDFWLNHAIFQIPHQEAADRLSFLERLTEDMGVPILSDELKEMILGFLELHK